MKWLFNRCRHYKLGLSLLAAHALSEAETAEVQKHLAECPDCQIRFSELKQLTDACAELGTNLPPIEPPTSLRRRWTSAVHESVQRDREPVRGLLPACVSGQRLAWGSLAAVWVTVLILRFSAPDAPKPPSVVSTPTSLREVLMVLRVGQRDRPLGTLPAEPAPAQAPKAQPLPPRSQRPGTGGHVKWEVI